MRTKEKVERHTNPPDNSPEEYAADRISGTAEVGAVEGVHQFDKAGRWGMRTTKENVSRARAHFEQQEINTDPRRAAAKKAGATPTSKSVSLEQQKMDSPKKQAREKNQNQIRSRARDMLPKPIKTADRKVSTIKTVERGGKTIKQNARSTGKATVKTAHRTIKTADQSAKTTIKTSQATAKAAQKSAQTAVKASRQAAQVARAAAKTTATGIKAAAKATASAIKAIIAATKALVAAIAAGGWIAVVVIVIICLIGLLAGSCFGIFFSGEDTGTGQTMQMVVRESMQTTKINWIPLKTAPNTMCWKCPVPVRDGQMYCRSMQ